MVSGGNAGRQGLLRFSGVSWLLLLAAAAAAAAAAALAFSAAAAAAFSAAAFAAALISFAHSFAFLSRSTRRSMDCSNFLNIGFGSRTLSVNSATKGTPEKRIGFFVNFSSFQALILY